MDKPTILIVTLVQPECGLAQNRWRKTSFARKPNLLLRRTFLKRFLLRISEVTGFTNKKYHCSISNFQQIYALQPAWSKTARNTFVDETRKARAVLPQIATGSRQMPN